MKRRIALSTPPVYFLWMLPVAALLAAAIYYTPYMSGALKLYPLITALVGILIFMGVFLFRLCRFTYDEVRTIGPFSSRDRTALTVASRLSFELPRRGRVRVRVYNLPHGDEVDRPAYLRGTENNPVCTLSVRVVGRRRRIRSLLAYYGIEAEPAWLWSEGSRTQDTPTGTLVTEEDENGRRTVSFTFAVALDIDGTPITDESV